MKSTSRAMKFDAPVLLATNTYGRLHGEVNGVAHTCRQLARCFNEAQIPLEIVTYGWDEGVETEGSVTVRVHRPRPGIAIDPALRIDPLVAFGASAREISRREYSLVHSTTPDPLGVFAADLASRRGLPFIAGYHTAIDDYVRLRLGSSLGAAVGELASRATRAYLREYYSRPDIVLAPSAATARSLSGWLPKPIRILGRGVDPRRFHPARQTVPRAAGPARALYVGRVAIEKGLDSLVPLFRRHKEISLTVVGDGPWLGRMRQLLPDARYTGTLHGDELSFEYANAGFFVFPSTTDTFGNVVLEAMSSGLPVVVTSLGGPAEIVRHGLDGFITGSSAEFESSVVRLACDGALRERMGHAARAAAECRSWPSIFASLLDIYEEAVALKNAAAPRRAARQRPALAWGHVR